MYALGELRTEVLVTSLEDYGSLILDLAEALGERWFGPPLLCPILKWNYD